MHDTTTKVTCEVKNCVYNDKEYCTASTISVGPSYAQSKAETICSTFSEVQ